MAFGYTTLTISGSNLGVSTPVELMRSLKTYLTNSLGWSLTEDRSDQAGVNSKIVLQSNGEDNTASTFYLVMTSGIATVEFQAGTFWNTTTHTVGSGVLTPSTGSNVSLSCAVDKTIKFWASGDKESITFIARRALSYDGVHIGRIRSFYPSSQDPFPIYAIGGSSEATDIDFLTGTSANANAIFDATSQLGGGECDWDSPFNNPLGSDQHPDNIFGSTERFTCFPMIAGVSDNSPVRRAIRGFSINIWATLGPNTTSMEAEDVFQAADGKTYQVFFNSSTSNVALVVRRS